MPACDPEKFVNREKELIYVKNVVTRVANGAPFAPDERVIHFVGPSNIGKSCLLEKLYETFDISSQCIPILIRLETFPSEGEALIGDFLTAVDEKFCMYQKIAVDKAFASSLGSLSLYSSVLVRSINLSVMDKALVLLLDEINVPSKEVLQGMQDHLLQKLLYDNNRAVLITAGRSAPMFSDFALRPDLKNTFVLSAFDEKMTSEQLERLKPGSAPLAGKVLELGGGTPGNNTKLIMHIAGDPPSLTHELQAVQSLLEEVKLEIEERFHPVIEAICILPDFQPDDAVPLLESHPALANQWDVNKLTNIFIDLKKVQIGPGGLIYWDRAKKSFVIDEPTHALFERELRMRAPELWKKLHCKAYQTFKQWGEELNSPLYREKAAYHQQCLQAAGYDLSACDY